MRYYKKILLIIPILGLLISSCDKWTSPEGVEVDHIGGYNTMNNEKSEAYYNNLRAWKATAEKYGRPVSFGWFSNWAPAGAVRKGYLSSLPDSIDMISIWSEPFNLSEAKIKDKEYVQKVKGTKIFVCYILHSIGTGITPKHVAENVKKSNPNLSEAEINKKIAKATEEYWGFKSGKQGAPDHIKAIQKYARVLCDSIEKNKYDGLDIDWEPSGAGDGYGNLKNYKGGNPGEYLHVLIKELSKYLGPKSGKENHKLLLIDGELSNVSPESGPYIDYFISQAYFDNNPEWRARSARSVFKDAYNTRKHIFTENFESFSQNGGVLLKQAKWNPSFGPKGGIGAYRIDNDYDNSPDYKFMRQAIQIMLKSYEEYLKKNPNN